MVARTMRRFPLGIYVRLSGWAPSNCVHLSPRAPRLRMKPFADLEMNQCADKNSVSRGGAESKA
jgi:hypothetical protein